MNMGKHTRCNIDTC